MIGRAERTSAGLALVCRGCDLEVQVRLVESGRKVHGDDGNPSRSEGASRPARGCYCTACGRGKQPCGAGAGFDRAAGPTTETHHKGPLGRQAQRKLWHPSNFFYFYIIIFQFIKNIYQIFFKICHPDAGSSGGSELSPDGPAIGAVGHGLTTFRRFNWR